MDVLSDVEQKEYERLIAKSQASGDMTEIKQFINDKVSCRIEGKPANFGDGTHYKCPLEGGKRRKSRKMRRARKSLKVRRTKKTKRRMRKGGDAYDADAFKKMYSSVSASLAAMKDKASAMKDKASDEAKRLAQAYSGGKRRKSRKMHKSRKMKTRRHK